MRRTSTALVVLLAAAPLAAGAHSATDLANAECAKGSPWRVAAAGAGDNHPESVVRLQLPEARLTRICNCTAPTAGKNTGVSVNPGSGTEVHFLASGGCMHTGAKTVTVKSREAAVETWGTFTLEAP